MRSRITWVVGLALTASLLTADPARAQQMLNLSAGGFLVRGEDGRIDGDVLIANRELFLFDFGDFTSISIGADWLVPIGDYLEAGAGVGFARRAVPTVYDQYVRPDGSEIEQELRLRIAPFSATLRILPLGRSAAVQPYLGGGIGVNSWRYSETGDFIDFSSSGRPVFRDRYLASGTALGPVAVFGVRVPMGRFSLGGEVKYQKAEGDLDEADFLGPKIDLGGFHYAATFGVDF